MDITVTPAEHGIRWLLTDLLGRSLGTVTKRADGKFTIIPEASALASLAPLHVGPFDSLDEALAEIERRTRGVCRMAPSPG